MPDQAPAAAPVKKPLAKTKVIVEAVRRQGFPGFYCLGRLFPTETPVEVEVTTEDTFKTRKLVDPVTDEATTEEYLYLESELKRLKRHSTWLKIYETGQNPVAGPKAVVHGTPAYLERAKEQIDIANEEALGAGDKGPTGAKR